MSIQANQIGNDPQSKLLWQISKQLDNLKKIAPKSDPALLAKVDELISATSEIELSSDSINLNTDQLESLITESNLLLEEIKTNTASSAVFDGQLTQGGSDVSDINPLPVNVGNVLPLPTGASTSDLQTAGNTSLSNIDKNTVIFYTEDIEEDTSTSTTYVGKQSNSGTWLVQKVVESTVGTINTTLIEYATVLNNPTVLTYTNAWSGRATLIYSQIKNLL